MGYPIEITESLTKFKRDFPDPRRCGFLMMTFRDIAPYKVIVECLCTTLSSVGLTLLRSDHRWYHPDLYWNVITYAHGCGFGIALFERIESEAFNPNVAFELGYMTGIGKPVCLLKDNTMVGLYTDMIGKLFVPFDTRNPDESVPPAVTKWLTDAGFITAQQSAKAGWKAYVPDLTPRERQVLRVIELGHTGYSNEAIAERLRMHLYDVFTICRNHGLPTKRGRPETRAGQDGDGGVSP